MRRRIGADEIIHEEPHAEAAEAVAAALPELRRRTEELVGLTAPPVRVTMGAKLPPLWQYFRPTPTLLGWFGGITAALTIAAMGIASVVDPHHWRYLIVSGYAVLVLGWALLRYYWVIGLLGGVLLTAGTEPRAFAVFTVAPAATILAIMARRTRRSWPFAGGFAFAWRSLVTPVILLHWPAPKAPPEAERLCFPAASPQDRVRQMLAHEFAHVALHLRYRHGPPAWLDEGFAFWLSEQLTDFPLWRPESRACVAEPEPRRDARERFRGQDWYYRLMARYYWEVRALVEEGRLAEVLAAPVSQVDRFRPSLSAPAAQEEPASAE